MFPLGAPGVALLVLRVCVAATLVADGTDYGGRVTSFWMLCPIVLTSVCLCFGFLTPYCAALSCLMEFRAYAIHAGPDIFHVVISVLTSAVLAILGPGGYSIDARIFGRRLLSLPPRQFHHPD